jgi:hypothetical protein
MHDYQLSDALNSMGKACFVEYYCKFADFSLSNKEVVELLMKNYTKGVSTIRVSRARSIIRAGRAKDALTIISQAARVSPQTRARAKELLDTKF